jgi:CRISPR-associated protein Cas5d
MTDPYPPVQVRVWGELACFTRPEAKVERVSYPVMTPSAAQGVLSAIFWKPEFEWRILAIYVLQPIRYFSLLRNEVNARQSDRAARSWQREGGGYDAASDRAQRHTLALREVDYLIEAQVDLKPHADADPAKYRDQLRRRLRDGRCFATPYLGCREFSCAFAEPDGSERPIELSDDLGPMLLGLSYDADRSGRGRPRFFNARLERGVLRVPQLNGAEV